MANKLISFTVASTGIKTITGMGFNPNDLEFFAAAKNGAASQLSVVSGQVDSAGNQFSKSDYYGPTSYTSNSSASECFHIREHTGGTWVDVLVFSFDSYITDGFKINVTTYNGGSAYQVRGKARLV